MIERLKSLRNYFWLSAKTVFFLELLTLAAVGLLNKYAPWLIKGVLPGNVLAYLVPHWLVAFALVLTLIHSLGDFPTILAELRCMKRKISELIKLMESVLVELRKR